MSVKSFDIVFVDNAIHNIYRTIDVLRESFGSVTVFNQEQYFLEHLKDHSPDVIFLNLDLQPNDAVILLKEIKQRKLPSNPYVIIYTEKLDDFVQELAFNSGADSFIHFHTKPPVMELFLRNLVMRRKFARSEVRKNVTIDEEKYLVYKGGEPIQLPRKEFRLFELLYNNAAKFFSKEEIAELIWKDVTIARKRTIDVHVYNIRQLFGKRIIQSQKGVGYRINKKLIGENNIAG